MLRTVKSNIYNFSGNYLSQYSTIYHILACEKLVTLSIAYLIQSVNFWVP